MTAAHVIILLVTGIGVGFASGLLGVGGAFIMTPVQYMVFTDMAMPADVAIKLAFGTSLTVILFTAASGAWRHSRKGAVRWKVAVTMGICSMFIAIGGATLAAHLPGPVLKTAFGVVVILSGVRMLIARPLRIEKEPEDSPWLWAAWSVPIGLMAGLTGIGGGVLVLPILVVALKFGIHEAVATSLAVVMFTSIGGVIGYVANGIGVSGLPAYSIGYVNLSSWFLLTVGSVGMAQVGAITAHKLPADWLRYVFIVIMLYMGLKMLGVFEWLGWPI